MSNITTIIKNGKITKTRINQLIEEYMPDSYFAFDKYTGEQFLTVSDWSDLEAFMAVLTKQVIGEELFDKYYRQRGVIKQGFYGQELLSFGDLRVGVPDPKYKGEPDGVFYEKAPYYIPEEVKNKFIAAGVIEDEYSYLDFENIVAREWGFSDEYTTCSDCGYLIKTSPDSYSWLPDYWMSEYGILCEDCVRDNSSAYIEFLTNNPDCANTLLSEQELEKQNFTKLEGIQHYQMFEHNITPTEKFNELQDEYEEVLFDLINNAQFGCSWQVWVREL